MNPKLRRRVAAGHVLLSVLVGFPLSWWLPGLDSLWKDRVLLLVSFYAITLTSADVWQTTDVRTQQSDDET